VVDQKVERVRIFSASCELDAGGRSLQWLERVDPVGSVRLLETLATAGSSEKVRSGALMATALHGGQARDAAADTLIRLARTAEDRRTRGDALFWLRWQAPGPPVRSPSASSRIRIRR
jgi:hypothetical protein